MRAALAASVLVSLLAPAVAAAGAAEITAREIALHPSQAGERTTASSPGRFDLVGVHWLGAGSVEIRTRRPDGRWSPWEPVEEAGGDQPDPRSAEGRRSRSHWRLGDPVWVGVRDRLEVRARGPVRRVRAFFVHSPEVRVPLRTVAVAGAPPVVPRSGWLADESIVRAQPQLADEVRYAVVHHTAGANDYTAAQAPAVVRAIQLYHVKANGWNDIGYNALVDRFGVVYEGRAGGLDRNVVGAHARGFNTGSFGIAVLGEFTRAEPTASSLDALARTIAWRLDLAHTDPLTTLDAISSGSERFPPGLPVFLRRVSGHRDTGLTSCPGDRLYTRLDELARRAQAVGLPKLYEPEVTGTVGTLVRFRARLSGALPWSVAVTDAAGLVVASGSGTGPAVDWAWDAGLATAGSYRWEIAVPGARSITGSLGGAAGVPALAITEASTDPETITPNDDGQADTTTLTYGLSAPAVVRVAVVDATGATVAELVRGTWKRAGEHVLLFDGLGLPDGAYQLQLTAEGQGGVQAAAVANVLVTRTLGTVALAPVAFSPNADGRADRLSVRFTLAGPADVRVRVLRDGAWVATPFSGPLAPGARVVAWDGAKRAGRIRDGSYEAVVEATDAVGTAAIALPFESDTRPPRVTVLPGTPLRLQVSEPATLALRVDGVSRSVRVEGGDVRIGGVGSRARVRIVAWDGAGNASAPLLRRPERRSSR
jgi:hypothetical protein